MPMPASKKQIERAGQRIANGEGTDADESLFRGTLASYDVMRQEVYAALMEVPWARRFGRGSRLVITSRTKTRGTLLDKLRRETSIKLPAVRDIAGIRIVADVGLIGQDQIAETILGLGILSNHKLIDRRAEPMQGYRALHMSGSVDSMSVEIQIRTTLQAAWANLYERLGDRWGREIRYGTSEDVDVTEPSALAALREGSGDARLVLLTFLRYVSLHLIAELENMDQRNVDLVRGMFGCDPDMDSRLRLAYRDPKLRARYPDLADRLKPMFDGQAGLITKLDDLLASVADKAALIPAERSDET